MSYTKGTIIANKHGHDTLSPSSKITIRESVAGLQLKTGSLMGRKSRDYAESSRVYVIRNNNCLTRFADV